jgi:hypothetical protein
VRAAVTSSRWTNDEPAARRGHGRRDGRGLGLFVALRRQRAFDTAHGVDQHHGARHRQHETQGDGARHGRLWHVEHDDRRQRLDAEEDACPRVDRRILVLRRDAQIRVDGRHLLGQHTLQASHHCCRTRGDVHVLDEVASDVERPCQAVDLHAREGDSRVGTGQRVTEPCRLMCAASRCGTGAHLDRVGRRRQDEHVDEWREPGIGQAIDVGGTSGSRQRHGHVIARCPGLDSHLSHEEVGHTWLRRPRVELDDTDGRPRADEVAHAHRNRGHHVGRQRCNAYREPHVTAGRASVERGGERGVSRRGVERKGHPPRRGQR